MIFDLFTLIKLYTYNNELKINKTQTFCQALTQLTLATNTTPYKLSHMSSVILHS